MRKLMWFAVFIFGLAMQMSLCTASAPEAHADYFNYPCQPPGVGTGVQIHIIIDASGQFCDGPTEINLTHYHCESGGGGISGGAIGLAPSIAGFTVGSFGGSGFGGGGDGCSYRCPDNTVAPQPNPPGVGTTHYIDVRAVIKVHKAFCVKENHLVPAGPTSVLVDPDEGFPPVKDPESYQVDDPNVKIPSANPVGMAPQPKPKEPESNPVPQGNIDVPGVPNVPNAIGNLPVPVIPPVLPIPGQG